MRVRTTLMHLAHLAAALTLGLVISALDSLSTPVILIIAAVAAVATWGDYLAHRPVTPQYDLIAHQVAAEQGFDLSNLDKMDRHLDAQFKRDFDKEL